MKMFPYQDDSAGFEPDHRIGKAEYVSLAVFLMTVFLFRTFNLQTYDVLSADGTAYGPVGRSFFQSGSFRVFGTISGPVYPFLAGLFDLVLHDLERSLRMVSVLFSTATTGIVYLFARKLFGVKGAVAAAVICASLPFLHDMSGVDIIEPTFTFFLTASAFLLWCAYLRSSAGYSSAAGLLMGVAYLSRSEGFISWFALTFLLIIVAVNTFRRDGMRLPYRIIAPFCVGFMLLFIPYLVYLHAETGIWQLSGKSALNAQVIREYLGKANVDQKFRLGTTGGFDEGKNESLARLFKEEPELMKQNIMNNIKLLPVTLMDAMTWYLLLAVMAAVACAPWTARYLVARGMLIGICSPLVIYLLFFIQPRGFYPYVAFLCIWAGGGISFVDRIVPQVLKRFHISLVITAILLAGFVYVDFPRQKPPYDYNQDGARRDDKHIGLRLKAVLPQKAVLMTRSGRIGFYSERPYVIPPQESFEAILAYAARNGVTHLVVTPQLIGMRPQLEFLFTPVANPGAPFTPPAGMKIVHAGWEPGGLPYLVYQLQR